MRMFDTQSGFCTCTVSNENKARFSFRLRFPFPFRSFSYLSVPFLAQPPARFESGKSAPLVLSRGSVWFVWLFVCLLPGRRHDYSDWARLTRKDWRRRRGLAGWHGARAQRSSSFAMWPGTFTSGTPLRRAPPQYSRPEGSVRFGASVARFAAAAAHYARGSGCFPAATSALGLGSPLAHLHRDWAHRWYTCTGTGLTPDTSAATALWPHLPLRCLSHPCLPGGSS